MLTVNLALISVHLWASYFPDKHGSLRNENKLKRSTQRRAAESLHSFYGLQHFTWPWLSLWAHDCRFWAISETPCWFNLQSSLQWKFLPLEILVNLIAIEMHKWNDKSCILSAITAIFFYLLESDLCCIDELHFFKVYFPISKVRLFIKWLAQNVVLPSPVFPPLF